MSKPVSQLGSLVLTPIAVTLLCGNAFAQSQTAITYQGQLKQNGQAVHEPTFDTNMDGIPDSGGCSFRFMAYADLSGPSAQGTPSVHNVVEVDNGLFTVADIDFGPGVFVGNPRWMEIEVQCPSDGGWQRLSPRQPITASPYAIHGHAPWQTAGPDVSFTGGNVGIGTVGPAEALDVAGDLRIVSDSNVDGTFGAGALIVQNSTGNFGLHIDRNDIRTVGSGSLNINGDNVNNTRINNFLHVKVDSKVGIGTSSPDSMLHVAGEVTTDVLTILAGSDLAERFDVDGLGRRVEPGLVVSIDPVKPGKLVMTTKRHDHAVAGVVSGAGPLGTGLVMVQTGSIADGDWPVALTGRVYVWVDADYGAVHPGDFLTTSGTPGHAMKVVDHVLARGAILGKAMTSLEEGRGLVLTLVGLQ